MFENRLLTISERLKDLRVERKLTLQQLSKATGIACSVLHRYENIDCKNIRVSSVIALANFYGVSADYLLGLTDKEA